VQKDGPQVESDLLAQMQNLAVPLGRFYYLGQEFLRVWVRDLEGVAIHGGTCFLMHGQTAREALNWQAEALLPPKGGLGRLAKGTRP
jgi:hypothetical protein